MTKQEKIVVSESKSEVSIETRIHLLRDEYIRKNGKTPKFLLMSTYSMRMLMAEDSYLNYYFSNSIDVIFLGMEIFEKSKGSIDYIEVAG